MKNILIKLGHVVLGYQRYLRYFTRFKITFLKYDRRKNDFLFFEKLISDYANIVIIGANTGITTIPLAKRKSERRIYAYEPVPSNFEVLENCILYYSITNIKSYMIALGNKKGDEEVLLPIHGGAKKHGLAHINSSSIVSLTPSEKLPVLMDKLDNRIELQNIRIDAIKLVAENYETEIIKGAKNLITKHKPLIYCELWHNTNRISTMKLIREYGYQIYYREGDRLKKYKESAYSGRKFFFKSHEI